MKIFKKLKLLLNSKQLEWLIAHQEELKAVLETTIVKNRDESDKNYSIAGVPEYQKKYIEDLMSGKIDTKNRR